MADLLNRIDNAVGGLCPCGAEPATGSGYCSDDCRPTHRGPDTDAPWLGGPHAARWRPDLVDIFDDRELTFQWRHEDGRFTRTWYTHTDGSWFLRLDDGHRFVGLTVPAQSLPSSRAWEVERGRDPGQDELWYRLERELTDPRRLDQAPAVDVVDIPTGYGLRDNEPLRQRVCDWLGANGIDYERVPMDADISIVDGFINYEIFQPDGPGPLREACLAPLVEAWVPLCPEPSVPREEPAQRVWRIVDDPPGRSQADVVTVDPGNPTAGALLWIADPPADLEAPTQAELEGGVDLAPAAEAMSQAVDAYLGLPQQSQDELARVVTDRGGRPRRRLRIDLRVDSRRFEEGMATASEAFRRVGEQMVAAGAGAIAAHQSLPSATQQAIQAAVEAERDRLTLRAVCADEGEYERALRAAQDHGLTVREVAEMLAAGQALGGIDEVAS